MSAVSNLLFSLAVAATAAEALVAWRSKRGIYRRDELHADLLCAAAGFGVFGLHRGVFLSLYAATYARWGNRAWDGAGLIASLIAFLIYDFVYYVDHRSTHGFAPLWASHRVHHQTKAFHLLTGLRMSVVGPLLGYPFRLPLAILGIPPATYVAVDVAHALFTYFLHARFVGDLGPIGWVFNTPAHHRVHHSAESAHFGRNYGGVLLLWDRLFGTYHRPEPVTTFGDGETTRPLGPIAAHTTSLRAWWTVRGFAKRN